MTDQQPPAYANRPPQDTYIEISSADYSRAAWNQLLNKFAKDGYEVQQTYTNSSGHVTGALLRYMLPPFKWGEQLPDLQYPITPGSQLLSDWVKANAERFRLVDKLAETEAKLKDAEGSHGSIKSAFTNLRDERDALAQQIFELKQDRAYWPPDTTIWQTNATLSLEKSKLLDKLTDLQAAKDKLFNELADANTRNEHLKNDLVATRSLCDRWNNEAIKVSLELQSAKTELTKREAQLKSVGGERDFYYRDLIATIEGLTKLKQERAEGDLMVASFGNWQRLKDELAGAKQRIYDHEVAYRADQARIASFEFQRDELRRQIDSKPAIHWKRLEALSANNAPIYRATLTPSRWLVVQPEAFGWDNTTGTPIAVLWMGTDQHGHADLRAIVTKCESAADAMVAMEKWYNDARV